MTDVSDTFDVPVVLRHTSLDASWTPGSPAAASSREKWSASPREGDYLLATNWRELLLSAFSVGRDLSPWVNSIPSLAVREILSRRFLLEAYLSRQPTPKTFDPAPPSHAIGFEITPRTPMKIRTVWAGQAGGQGSY